MNRHTKFEAAFDDLVIGQCYIGGGRTITETDLALSCMLSGDWHPMHADSEFCKTELHSEQVLHGGFGVMLALGMATGLPMFSGKIIGVAGLREWRFRNPIYKGDTVRLEAVVSDKQVTSDGVRAIIERQLTLRNQAGHVVQQGYVATMIQLETQDESRTFDRT